MILPDYELALMAKTGMIEPYDFDCINPASIDLRFGNTIQHLTIDCEVEIDNQYILLPGAPILATTVEYINLPDDIAAMIMLKSSLARQGLDHALAGWIDPGFSGEITLELHAHRPVFLAPNQRIVQMVCYQMKDTPNNPYNGKYLGQRGPTKAK